MICRMALLIPQIKNRALLTAAAASLVQRTAGQMKRFRKRKRTVAENGPFSYCQVKIALALCEKTPVI